jgi:uncharacterized protein (TIGR02246 family)
VAFVVDDTIGEGAEGMRFVEVRGRAQQAQVDPPASEEGVAGHIIRIHPRRIVSWNADPDHPGFQTQTQVSNTGPEGPTPGRPTLGTDQATTEAAEAVAGLLAELQAGIDDHDADVYNRHFAADVIWGSPYGAIVQGYDELHAIHAHLLEQGTGGPPSRYEAVQIVAPGPDVVLAHVRRVALDPTGRPLLPTADSAGGFSEMALYVLVRRGRDWWLAAGQNTPIA